MEKTCNNCKYADLPKRLCRKESPIYKLNDWTGQGTWPKINLEDWCGKWDGGSENPEIIKVSSTISCPVCGLSWTAHEGSSWNAVIEAKKSHECIPLNEVHYYPTNV